MLAQRDAEKKKGSPSSASQATPSTVSSKGSDRSSRLFVSPSREDVFASATPATMPGRQSEARRRWRGEAAGIEAETVEPLRRQIEALKEENRHLTELLDAQRRRADEIADMHDADLERSEERIGELEKGLALCQARLQSAVTEQRQTADEFNAKIADDDRIFQERILSMHAAHAAEISELEDELLRERAAHEADAARIQDTHQKERAELHAAVSAANRQPATPVKSSPTVQHDRQPATPDEPPRTVPETPLSRPSSLLDEMAAAALKEGGCHSAQETDRPPALGLGLGVFAGARYLSDVDLVLGPEEARYKAHRIILAAHTASIFHSHANPIRISSYPASTLKLVLAWMYAGALPPCGRELAQVHECADSIGLTRCASDCLAKFGDLSVNDAVSIYDATNANDVRFMCVQALARSGAKGAAPMCVLQLAHRHGMLRHVDRATLHVDYLGWCLDVSPQ